MKESNEMIEKIKMGGYNITQFKDGSIVVNKNGLEFYSELNTATNLFLKQFFNQVRL
jgi:hypothetical protein